METVTVYGWTFAVETNQWTNEHDRAECERQLSDYIYGWSEEFTTSLISELMMQRDGDTRVGPKVKEINDKCQEVRTAITADYLGDVTSTHHTTIFLL